MRHLHPKTLLNEILRDGDFARSEIESLCTPRDGKVQESLWLDFKSADSFDERRRRETAKSLVKDATAFANSDGGLLVFGVEDDGRILANVPAGSEAWVTSVLKGAVDAGVPAPRVIVKDGLLVVACPRAAQLVPQARDGSVVYFMRFGDGTAQVPEYLLTDLFLGRRAHPAWSITSALYEWVFDRRTAQITVYLDLMNDSPIWVDDLVLYWCGIANNGEQVASSLLRELNVHGHNASSLRQGRCRLIQTSAGPVDIMGRSVSPMSTLTAVTSIPLPPLSPPELPERPWRGALVVVPKGMRTQVFEMSIDLDWTARRAGNTSRFPFETRNPWPDRATVSW